MSKITIAPKGDKGRSFSAELLAYAEADYLWEGGQTSTDVTRPIWMVLGGSEQEMRSFLANLFTGKVAQLGSSKSSKFEILKSAGFAHHSVKLGGGVVTTVYLPSLFQLDPMMVDPAVIEFAVLPPKTWVDAQQVDLIEARALFHRLSGQTIQMTDEALHLLLAEGILFLSYLDRRCRYPIPFHPAFGAWLMLVCQLNGLLQRPTDHYSSRYKVSGADKVQVHPGFAYCSSHEHLGSILSQEVQKWFPAVDLVSKDMLEMWLNSL